MVLLVATRICWVSCWNKPVKLLILYLLLLLNSRLIVEINLFFRSCFGISSPELAEVIPLPYFHGQFFCYSNMLHDFSAIIWSFYEDLHVKFFLFQTTGSLVVKSFPFIYNLNGFKSKFNRHALSFLISFPICFSLFFLLFLVTPGLIWSVQLYIE